MIKPALRNTRCLSVVQKLLQNDITGFRTQELNDRSALLMWLRFVGDDTTRYRLYSRRF